MDSIDVAQADQSQSLRIFLVDSHADTLTALTRFLQLLGHSVTSAGTVADALATWPQAFHDVLITELLLSDGDGCELLGILSPRPRYAIAATSHGLLADRARSQAAGFRRHLLKPFKSDELEAALHQATREISGVPSADIHEGA